MDNDEVRTDGETAAVATDIDLSPGAPVESSSVPVATILGVGLLVSLWLSWIGVLFWAWDFAYLSPRPPDTEGWDSLQPLNRSVRRFLDYAANYVAASSLHLLVAVAMLCAISQTPRLRRACVASSAMALASAPTG